ncbi:hypothetical protein [Rheinheimera maricola]|uniref:Tetratricopeptide repeat protein n=1 Tax=Rheinheimera maricola TaxID=2793282 RepID=A0ABS7X468_9GAMM|nr:hypothetical protein [Rheinheimera maricola]MBZ9610342.1 hypothetical protein [Rheinheimera maricola]
MSYSFLKDIEHDLGTWPGEVIAEASFIRGHNINSAARPLFWCTQMGHVFGSLINELGNELALYGLRSGHLLMEYTAQNIEVLTDVYAEQIRSICRNKGLKAITLGGSCQGAGLMLIVAQKLEQLGDIEFSVIVLESILPKRILSPVTLIFGRTSSYNLFRRYHDVEKGLSAYYANFEVGIVPGSHGQFYGPNNIRYLGKFLTGKNSQRHLVLKSESNAKANLKNVDIESDFNRLTLLSCTFNQHSLNACTDTMVVIVLENKGGKPIDADLYTISNQWYLNESLVVYRWLDGKVDVPFIAPGAKATLYLRVRTPLTAGQFVFRLRVSVEGSSYSEFEQQLAVKIQQRPLQFHIAKPTRSKSSRAKLMQLVRAGRVDCLVKTLSDSTFLTRRQWSLMLTVLAKDDRWYDIATIVESLKHNYVLSNTMYIVYLEALVKLGREQIALTVIEQDKGFHAYLDGGINKLYLHALLHSGEAKRVYQLLFATDSFPVQGRNQVLLLLISPFALAQLDQAQVMQVVSELYNINKSVESFLKTTHALIANQLYEKALEFVKTAVELYPRNVNFNLRLARLNDLLGNRAAAFTNYNFVLELVPGNKSAADWLHSKGME